MKEKKNGQMILGWSLLMVILSLLSNFEFFQYFKKRNNSKLDNELKKDFREVSILQLFTIALRSLIFKKIYLNNIYIYNWNGIIISKRKY